MSVATLFFGYLVWVLFANLWIGVILIAPAVWAARRGRMVYGRAVR